MSEKLMTVLFDGNTNKTTKREINSDELLTLEESRKYRKFLESQEEVKKNLRKSALSKLANFGLTEDEIASL
jgi:hypothetical protein